MDGRRSLQTTPAREIASLDRLSLAARFSVANDEMPTAGADISNFVAEQVRNDARVAHAANP